MALQSPCHATELHEAPEGDKEGELLHTDCLRTSYGQAQRYNLDSMQYMRPQEKCLTRRSNAFNSLCSQLLIGRRSSERLKLAAKVRYSPENDHMSGAMIYIFTIIFELIASKTK